MRALGSRDLLWALVPAALCAVLLAAADPRGAFPLNDDFQWSDAAFGFAQGRGLRFAEWVYASAVTHVLLGALPAWAFGASDWVLRLWNMAWGCAAAGGAFLVARRFGAGVGTALAAACALAADPLHLAMSASFHLEITLMVALLLALLAFLDYEETGSLLSLAAASLALGAATLTRQTAAVAALPMAGLLAARGRLGPRQALALLGPLAVLFASWRAWFLLVHGPTYSALVLKPAFLLSDVADPAALAAAARRAGDAALTAAFLAFPLAAAAAPGLRRLPLPGRWETGALGLALAAWLDARGRGGMPLIGNTLTRSGLGVLTLNDPVYKEAGWWGSAVLWSAIDALALLSACALIRIFWNRDGQDAGSSRARATLLIAAVPVLATAVFTPQIDRYLLAWLPLLLVAGAWAAGPRTVPALGLATALVLGSWSAAGLRDYFAWNRARAEAGRLALARGVPPAMLENGFDWDGRLTLDKNMKLLLAERPASEIGGWDWMKLNKIVALTSYAPRPPRPDFVLVDSVPYPTPLTREDPRIYLYGLVPPGR